MDREDRRRYFIVGSVILEVVTPLFWKRIENDYTNSGLASLQDFLNQQSTIHILFHLRHRNTWCCKDKTNCSNNGALPLNYCQWDLLYTETNPGVNPHGCHCKFSANPVQLDILDITLGSLILLNCCNLTPDEKAAIKKLRQYKNDYLSHNIKGAITKREYKTLWADLTNFILQLDSSKQDDMTRIEARPLDEALCSRYCLSLLDLHKRLDEIDGTIKTMNHSVQGTLQNMGTSVQGSLQDMETSILGTLNNIDTSLQELLYYARRGRACNCYTERSDSHDKSLLDGRKSHQLGQRIFTLHHQIDLTSVVCGDNGRLVSDILMMDDGRLVICFPYQRRLLICNTDGSHVDSIDVQGNPGCVTAVNNSTVAITGIYHNYIEMYDINNKLYLKSLPVSEMHYEGITTINNMLVVGGVNRLLVKDHQTGEVVQTIKTDCNPWMLHSSDDRIFYYDYNNNNNNKLYWYSFTDECHHTTTLPSKLGWMTTLQDASMYVVCIDGSVQHVSSDGKQHKTVTGLCLGKNSHMSYNRNQKKLVTVNKVQGFAREVVAQIFDET